MDEGCIFSCLISAIGYRPEQSRVLGEFIRMEVAAEAREGRLPLRQVFESCKYREVGDPPRFEKDDVVAATAMAKSRSQ